MRHPTPAAVSAQGIAPRAPAPRESTSVAPLSKPPAVGLRQNTVVPRPGQRNWPHVRTKRLVTAVALACLSRAMAPLPVFGQSARPDLPTSDRPPAAEAKSDTPPRRLTPPGRQLDVGTLTPQPDRVEEGRSRWTLHLDLGGSRDVQGGPTARIAQPPANPNAPWAFRGGVRYSRASATVALNVVGSRNYRLPLFLSRTLVGDQDLALPLASFADMSMKRTEWQLSASLQKTVGHMRGGGTIGLAADAFIPLAVGSPSPIAAVESRAPSRALRFGVVFGF